MRTRTAALDYLAAMVTAAMPSRALGAAVMTTCIRAHFDRQNTSAAVTAAAVQHDKMYIHIPIHIFAAFHTTKKN